MAPHGGPLPLFTISIQFPSGSSFTPEGTSIRRALDEKLRTLGKPTVSETASTIFPESFWRLLGRPGIDTLREQYVNELLPRYRKRKGNSKAETYFGRMVSCEGIDRDGKPRSLDQLEHIIQLWRKARAKGRSPRRSALQISCLDPAKDQNGSALSGFPCLQQISITYDENAIGLNAYYPAQYIVDRAFGNFHGLAGLGFFLAEQMGCTFRVLNCVSGHPQLGDDMSKSSLRDLEKVAKDFLESIPNIASANEA